MPPLIYDFPSTSSLGDRLRKALNAEKGEFIRTSFPDGETYLRLKNSVKDRPVILNASLFPPNPRVLDLLFLADTLRNQGAKTVGLLLPYLPYMRQDKVFQPGEALTSKSFARLLSTHVDFLVTVDPHLHRYHTLSEIYTIPTTVVQAAPLLATWIKAHIPHPFIIGPDEESRQWVQDLSPDAPCLVLKKHRAPEGDVTITWPDHIDFKDKTPVFVDDIVSSGGTLLQAIDHLKDYTSTPPTCVIIHPLFCGDAYQNLRHAGAHPIVSCNSLPHPSNEINLAPLLAPALAAYLPRR